MAASSNIGGYDFKVVGEAPKDLECPICLVLLRQTIETPCSHLLCKTCVEKWEVSAKQIGSQLLCPTCKEQFKMEQIHRNGYVDRLVRNVEVYCQQNNVNGLEQCEWTGTLSNYQQVHEAICDYKAVMCPNDECDWSDTRRFLKYHQKKCPRRLVICQFCKNEFPFTMTENHQNNCEKLPIYCPNHCQMMVPRDEIQNHLDENCELKLVECPFKQIGCHQKRLRKDVDYHIQQYNHKHMMLMMENSKSTQMQLKELKEKDLVSRKEIEKFKEKNYQLQNEIDDLKNHFRQASDNKITGHDLIRKSLINGFEQFISQKIYSENYKAWYDEINERMEAQKVYKYKNYMFFKIIIIKEKSDELLCYSHLQWFSNNKEEQVVDRKQLESLHTDKDVVLRYCGSFLLVSTETFDEGWNHDNVTKAIVVHQTEADGIENMVEIEKEHNYNSWLLAKQYTNIRDLELIFCMKRR